MLTLSYVPPLQFDMFLKNSLGVLFFLFFLFQLAMSGLAFLVSTAVSKASTGTNLGFAIFLVGWIMQVSLRCPRWKLCAAPSPFSGCMSRLPIWAMGFRWLVAFLQKRFVPLPCPS